MGVGMEGDEGAVGAMGRFGGEEYVGIETSDDYSAWYLTVSLRDLMHMHPGCQIS
jgi:hypothetical protein